MKSWISTKFVVFVFIRTVAVIASESWSKERKGLFAFQICPQNISKKTSIALLASACQQFKLSAPVV